MLKRLLIVGAGGFGRQVESYIDDENLQGDQLPLAGFLDDNPNALANKGSTKKILGNLDTFQFEEGDAVILAIADTKIRAAINSRLTDKVAIYTYISKRAIIGKNVQLGKGSVVCPGVNIGCDTTIGKMALINLNVIIGHDSIIGDYCSFMPQVSLGGNCITGDHVYMGTKATITPQTKLTHNITIGCGAVVLKHVKDAGTYFGNPARRMI